MLTQSILFLLVAVSAIESRCSFSGEVRVGQAFVVCVEGKFQITGCADPNGNKLANGEAFDYTRSRHIFNRQRYRLRCGFENREDGALLKFAFDGCYDVEGRLAGVGEEYLWYNPFYVYSRYARFTRRCVVEPNGNFGFRNAACRGEKDERIEFGESYRPKAEEPNFVFDCVGDERSLSFDLRPAPPSRARRSVTEPPTPATTPGDQTSLAESETLDLQL